MLSTETMLPLARYCLDWEQRKVAEMCWATRTLGTPPRQLCQVKTDQLLFEAPVRKKRKIMETLSQQSFSLLPPVEKGQKRLKTDVCSGGFKVFLEAS